MEPFRKMKAPSGIRDFSVCQNERIILAVVYDTVRIYDTDLHTPIHTIKLDSTPRSTKLSQCGKYFYVHDSNNIIYLYDTKNCMIIQQIIGAPVSIKSIRFSKNSLKLIYASTQMLSLWNILKCSVDVRTQHWRNMNCYDVNADGSQFAIGTYNGIIYVLDFIQVGKCTQISIKRHKTCVASICCHQNQIISASHDGYFLISTIKNDSNSERVIMYNEMKIKTVPREIESIGNNFYMFSNEGMSWFNKINGLHLTGFTDFKNYKPFVNQQGKTMFASLYSGQIQWWPSHVFKTKAEIQKQKAQKQRQKEIQNEKQMRQTYRTQDGKQNRVVYKVVYRR